MTFPPDTCLAALVEAQGALLSARIYAYATGDTLLEARIRDVAVDVARLISKAAVAESKRREVSVES